MPDWVNRKVEWRLPEEIPSNFRYADDTTLMAENKKKQLELDMEQTGSKSRKEYIKAVYCHPVYFTYMQSTSWEMLDWMKHKLESRLLGETS